MWCLLHDRHLNIHQADVERLGPVGTVLADEVERLLAVIGGRNFVPSDLELACEDTRVDKVVLWRKSRDQ